MSRATDHDRTPRRLKQAESKGSHPVGSILSNNYSRLPHLPELPHLNLPHLSLPHLNLPHIDLPHLPSLPKFNLPHLPTLPHLNLPHLEPIHWSTNCFYLFIIILSGVLLVLTGTALGTLFGLGILGPSSSSTSEGDSTQTIPPQVIRVVLWVGQSNGWGAGTEIDSSIDTAPPGVFQYVIGDGLSSGFGPPSLQVNLSGTIQPLTAEPLYDNGQFMGAICSFARSYMAAHPDHTLVIVQACIPGTQLSPHATIPTDNEDWSPYGFLLPRALAATQATFALMPTATLHGIYWDQGENDICNSVPVSQSQYESYLIQLFNYFRSSFPGGTPETPIVLVGYEPYWCATVACNCNPMLNAQQVVLTQMSNLSFLAGIDSYDPFNGPVHFSSSAQRTFGAEAFAAFRSMSADF